MRATLDQIVIDCREPGRLVRFWAALLGGIKNRLHLDLAVDDIEAATREAEALGAHRKRVLLRAVT